MDDSLLGDSCLNSFVAFRVLAEGVAFSFSANCAGVAWTSANSSKPYLDINLVRSNAGKSSSGSPSSSTIRNVHLLALHKSGSNGGCLFSF